METVRLVCVIDNSESIEVQNKFTDWSMRGGCDSLALRYLIILLNKQPNLII